MRFPPSAIDPPLSVGLEIHDSAPLRVPGSPTGACRVLTGQHGKRGEKDDGKDSEQNHRRPSSSRGTSERHPDQQADQHDDSDDQPHLVSVCNRVGDPGSNALASIRMSELVRITDVSPRDGLQNEAEIVATHAKVALVRQLCLAHVDEIEVSSFVSPKWVPQLADAASVFAACAAFKPTDVEFSALVPNAKGLESAFRVNHDAGSRVIDKVSVFTAASETFSKRNTNASIAETLARFEPVLSSAKHSGLRVRAYLSCVIACPFEGPIDPAQVARVSTQLLDLGVDELDLGDTIGAGTPQSTRAMIEAVVGSVGSRLDLASKGSGVPLVLHFHDTFGRAAECVVEALGLGVRQFDGAAGGLGGCPYASTPDRRAPGNIATDTLVRTIESTGYRTRVRGTDLARASAMASTIVGRPVSQERGPP